MATTPVKQRVQKHRNALRKAGLRPVQIWVPDTRRPDFAEECRRQCLLVAQADSADAAMQQFMDEALADVNSEHSSVTVLPIAGTLVAAPLLRVTIQPTAENGLQKPFQKTAPTSEGLIQGGVGTGGADRFVKRFHG